MAIDCDERMTTGLTNSLIEEDPAGGARMCAPRAGEATRADVEMPIAQPGFDLGRDAQPPDAGSANASAEPGAWRVEVAARLERYRTRRKPRTPRYPSLLLPFDAPESWCRPAPSEREEQAATVLAQAGLDDSQNNSQNGAHNHADNHGHQAAASAELAEKEERSPGQRNRTGDTGTDLHRWLEAAPEPTAKVIEFPRSAAVPVCRSSDLADPVFDHRRPRIVEVPEILPPPPALGGILIEPAQREVADRHHGAALPSEPASIARRILGGLVDGGIVMVAIIAFAGIFLRWNRGPNPMPGPLPVLGAGGAVVAAALWSAYELLFLVYTGSTPGLRLARLQLAGFDGSRLTRPARRWRVLASLLSAFSAGLGYLWCLLDQDGLCWHDRITRTYLQRKARPPKVPAAS